MAAIRQDYSPIDSLQKMVDNIPNGGGSDRKKHKKHKKDKKEQVPQQPLQPLQTTSDFAPNELLKEMGFDISPTTSSTGSSASPTSIAVMDEKKYVSTYVSFIIAIWSCSRQCPTWNGT